MYKILRSLLFLFDPEKVHYFSMNALKALCNISFIEKMIAKKFTPVTKAVSFLSLTFRNRVGLGAGFDKNARYLRELKALGFGFIEIGTVTPVAQAGNEKPRLFRLPKDKALINRMGFNNDGVDIITSRLKKWREKYPAGSSTFIIGGNIGKNKVTPNEDAWQDYNLCFNKLYPYVDYFVVNVSSPNTPGLRELQEKGSLKVILTQLQQQREMFSERKPILLKIAPDLENSQIDDVISLAAEINLDGLVATNTTISRADLKTDAARVKHIGAGGLSGLPVQQKSTDVLDFIIKKTNGNIPVIASGGIFTKADAEAKLNAGAVLMQVWTGFVYEGPIIVKNICGNL